MLKPSPRLPMRFRFREALKAAFRFPGQRSSPYGYGGGSGYGGWLGGWVGLQPGSRYDFAKECGPLFLNGIVLAAINRFSLLWNEAPLVVYRPRQGDKPEMLKEHPALDLLAKPNDDYDDTVLWGSSMLSLLCAGNGYWIKELAGAGNLVRLQYVPDQFIEPYWTSNTEYITGYMYRVDGKPEPVPRDRVVHLRWMVSNPGNFRKGLSPLAAELKSIAIDNEVSNYTASILRNMGVPGLILCPAADFEILPHQAEAIKAMIRERFGGDNRGDSMVLDLPVKVDKPGFSPEELALDSIVRQPVPRICAALQIDPMVLGYESPSKTYANMDAALEAAYELTIIPLHSAISSQMTEQVMPWVVGAAQGDYFGRDYSAVRCLQDDADQVYKRNTDAVGGPWLTRNEAREMLGLPPVEGGDELYPPKGAGLGMGQPGQEGQPSVPRAASLSPTQVAKQAAIAAKWRVRAEERRQLAASNGHS